MRTDEDLCLAAAITFAYENEVPTEMVDVDLVTRDQFDSLMRYRTECRAKAASVASPEYNHFTWMSPSYNWFKPGEEHDSNCNFGGNLFIASVQGKSRSRIWWRSYIYEAKSRLETRPWGSTVTSGDFFDQALKEGSQCRCCRENLDRDFRQFTNIFADKIDEAVSQARYRISLSGNLSLTSVFGVGFVDVGRPSIRAQFISIFSSIDMPYCFSDLFTIHRFYSLPLSHIALLEYHLFIVKFIQLSVKGKRVQKNSFPLMAFPHHDSDMPKKSTSSVHNVGKDKPAFGSRCVCPLSTDFW